MKENLIGKRFGRLSIIAFDHRDKAGKGYYVCICDCGNQSVIRRDLLTRNITKSCGCLHLENLKAQAIKHGHCKGGNKNGNSTYISWHAMKQRCCDPHATQYARYGGAGITVCDRWINNFQCFLEDMGERPEGTTLDRINPYGNYEPSNCRWADPITQHNNYKRHYDQRLLAITV